MDTRIFRIRDSEFFSVWAVIIFIICISIFGAFFLNSLSARSNIKIELFEHIWKLLLIFGFLAATFVYFRHKGTLKTQYHLTAQGILLEEYEDWGFKTPLADILHYWNDIQDIRINEKGRIRLLFKTGDLVESKQSVSKASEFQSLARQFLTQARIPYKPENLTKPIGKECIWDVFISHASEDKETFVRPLAHELIERGLKVWYDEERLTLGDSITKSIDYGLAQSSYGIVVISESFFAKDWPQKELGGLYSRENNGKKVILPIWHELDVEAVRSHSPLLADRLAIKSNQGIQRVADEILIAISN